MTVEKNYYKIYFDTCSNEIRLFQFSKFLPTADKLWLSSKVFTSRKSAVDYILSIENINDLPLPIEIAIKKLKEICTIANCFDKL